MKKIAFVLIMISLILLSGCFFNKKNPCKSDCVSTSCIERSCSKDTGFACVENPKPNCDGNKICEDGEYLTSVDCPDCKDDNTCTEDTYNYTQKTCEHNIKPSCCGNLKCDLNETQITCPKDCPKCDDKNECTRDYFDSEKGKCQSAPYIPCCGNKQCEQSESYLLCPSDCEPSKLERLADCGTSDECKLDVAKQYLDWQICKNLVSKATTDDCHSFIAINTNKTNICINIENEKLKTECIEKIALNTKSASICTHYFTSPNRCLEQVAIAQSNSSTCNMLIEQGVRTLPGFIQKCQSLAARYIIGCKSITESWIADQCYSQMAVVLNDSNICDGIKGDKQICIDSVLGEDLVDTTV